VQGAAVSGSFVTSSAFTGNMGDISGSSISTGSFGHVMKGGVNWDSAVSTSAASEGFTASPAITSIAGTAANQILTDDGDATVTSESGLTFDGSTLAVTGDVFINETDNGNQTIGLTINQGANDDEIFACKSSDVSHLATGISEADTFFMIKKYSATLGGATLEGFGEGAAGNAGGGWLVLRGSGNDAPSTHDTSGIGSVIIEGFNNDPSGGGRGGHAAGDNICVIRDAATTRFIFTAEGTGYADDSWTTFSDNRLKKNQSGILYGLAEVNRLQPKAYTKYSGYLNNNPDHEDYKKHEHGAVILEEGSARKDFGFVAQEVKEIIPELVKDIDESESFYAMDDGKLTSVLVKAVQELSAKVEALENA
jgi:hypothetical protein